MPRQARVIVPGIPHHIVQRGHNRKAVFVEAADYRYYLQNLRKFKSELGIKIYSYCLMTNHVHLVVEPGDDVTSISQLMKQLAARQTRRVNKMEGRSGTLWEGRYKISPIQRDEYLLHCCRYVERNPVKARMVHGAEEYPWSSYRARAGYTIPEWLDIDEIYLALGATENERQARYKHFIENDVNSDVTRLIRESLARNQLTSNFAFIDEIELRIGIRIERRGPGRPNK